MSQCRTILSSSLQVYCRSEQFYTGMKIAALCLLVTVCLVLCGVRAFAHLFLTIALGVWYDY